MNRISIILLLLFNVYGQNITKYKAIYDKTIIIFIYCLFLAAGILYFIQYRKKQKQNNEKFKKMLNELDKPDTKEPVFIFESSIETSDVKTENISQAEGSSIMPPATEQKILAKLSKFEESNVYTNNNISIASLATYCETNTKYLSYVIRTHKDKDFNNYINELRINYIIHRLRTRPQYRKYKISTLAEEAGFSSPNKFAMIFKKSTSISPSLFIKYLEETNSSE